MKLPRNVEKLVAPPNGLKHTLLKTASKEEIITGMKQTIQDMIDTGTSSFCDFFINAHKISLLEISPTSLFFSTSKRLPTFFCTIFFAQSNKLEVGFIIIGSLVIMSETNPLPMILDDSPTYKFC